MFKKLLFLILILLLPLTAQATIYGAKPDGTCSFTNRANAVYANAAAVTASSTVANLLSMAAINNSGWAAGDIIYFSALNHLGVATAYGQFAPTCNNGSAGNVVSYLGIADNAGAYPVFTNTTDASNFYIGAISYMTISGFQIIAANAVANWDAIVFYGGAKTGDTLSNLTIDCTNATGTGSICGINGNSSTGPFNTFAMTNVTITMGAGAYKNAPFIFTGPSGTHGTPWTLTNVNTTGGTYSKIQYQDNITITGGSFESNTASGAGALDIVSSAGVLTVNGTAFDGGYGIVLNTCGSLTAGSTIENCTGANMIGNGILLNTASNVAVTGNNLQGVAGDNVSYAFQPATSCSFTNNILNGGAGEFYTYNSTSCTLTNNTAKNTTAHAFEIAGSSTGTIEEYNLAINCGLKTALAPGFGFYCHNTSSGTVIAYNIAANMVEGGCGFLDTSSGSCYNNIFYQCGGAWHTGYTQWDGTVIAANGGYLDSNEAGLYDSSSGVWTIKNNISVGNWPYEINCGSTNPVFNYNLYSPISANAFAYNFQVGGLYTWAAWKAAAFTPDVSSPTPANPNWISHPANGATSLSATDFQLAANSRAINIGTNLSLTPDYAGTTVPQGGVPDMGAYESTWCRWGANGVFGLTIWGVAGY